MRIERLLVLLAAALLLSAACGSGGAPSRDTAAVASSATGEPSAPSAPVAEPAAPAEPARPAEPVGRPEPAAPIYLHGKLVWYELESSDTHASMAFVTGLFGWTTELKDTSGIRYVLVKNGDKEIASIQTVAEKKEKSHWMPFVSVADVDAAAKAASENKGTIVQPPADIPEIGRWAIVADPNGATFVLFKSLKSDDPDPEPGSEPKLGEFVWGENLTRNKKAQAAALAFYPAVAGYTTTTMEAGSGKTRTSFDMLTANDRPRAGVSPAKPATLAGQWLPWVVVDDVDAAVAKVKGLKGKVAVKPHDVPTVGRAAIVLDPSGAPIGIIKSLTLEEEKAARAPQTPPAPRADKNPPR